MTELQRVMLVEDDCDVRLVAELALAEIGGFTLSVCCNGREALERVEQEPPQLILLDVMMPGMDGTSVLVQLRERDETAAIPVVMMTARVQPAEVERYRELGAVDVISKPFDPMLLADRVRAIWADHGGA